MEPINVLSLFDGISCGRVALERAGIPVGWYGASEVDKSAIAVALHNYPDTHTLGDVRMVSGDYLPRVDLLIGGSPCQGFSYAGNKLNFDDPRSRLFFEYVRLLEETKPRWFLLENVRMNKTSRDIISSYLGVEPVEIDSALVSAQHRKRLYWTNLPVKELRNRGLLVSDIYQETDYSPELCVPVEQLKAILEREVSRGKIARIGSPMYSLYDIFGEWVHVNGQGRVETSGVIPLHPPQRLCRQAGPQFSRDGRAFTLTGRDRPGVLYEGVFRLYTANEYERLQTLPDDYTRVDGLSYDKRAKLLGNGWTVDVIAHILSEIKEAV